LGYWILGNIHIYWVVLVLGDIFCCSDTQYNTNQTAVSTVHMPVKDYLVSLVTCTLITAGNRLSGHHADMLLFIKHNFIVIIIEFWDISWSLVIATLYTGISIGIGYWYR